MTQHYGMWSWLQKQVSALHVWILWYLKLNVCCSGILLLPGTVGALCYLIRRVVFLFEDGMLFHFELLFGLLPIQFHFEPLVHANCLIHYLKNRVLWFACLLSSWALLTYPHKAIPWLLTLFCFFSLDFVLPQIASVSLSFATSQTESFHFFIRVWELICLEIAFLCLSAFLP